MLIIASKKCMVKRTTIEDLGISKLTKSSMVMKLEENDAVVSAQIINQNDEDKNVCVITTTGRGIKYPLSQISVVGKNAAGVKNTGADEDIAALFVDHQNKEFACIAANQGFKRLKINDISLGARTNSPKFILSQIKSNPIVVINAFAVSQSDLISYVDATNQLATFKASEVPIGSTDTRVSSVTDHVIFEANSLVPIITKTKTLFES
jgi:topoisomerase-4 subunit A